MTRARIAAVITCRDLGHTLVEALRSLERQTRTAAEIVIVDDASTDVHTLQVTAQLEREGTFVAHGSGRGVSAARNLGAALTSAEYLVWLDADDMLEPGYFAAAAAHLDADPGLDFVSCAMRAFGEASYVWKPSEPEFVAAVATGGVPHASTMLRRRVWQAVGGFDETLPSFELLDFWASALERGFRGIILDEPLINYRIRPGSGYRRSIAQATYLARLRHFYDKHRASVERHGLDLLEAKEAFFISQRNYWRSLESRAVSLETELAQLQEEIARAARTLEARGLARVDWGDLRRVEPIGRHRGRDRGTSIDRYYADAFVEAHRSDVRGRVLDLRRSSLHARDAIATDSCDCVIFTGTPATIDDFGVDLAECARVLRPGGVLLATVPGVITDTAVRRLCAELFPVDAFEATACGNVMACTASLHGISAEELAPPDLAHVDSNFPLVITVRAVKPVSRSSDETSGVGRIRRGMTAAEHHRAVILCYHRIAELAPDSHALCTPPDEFRAHMACLSRDFQPIALDALVRAAASGRIPERAVAVTLDDGYLDALTVASPILLDAGVPATFFVNTDRTDEPHERWFDILERVLLCGEPLPPELALRVNGHDLRLATATAAARRDALEVLNRAAWPLDAHARAAMLEAVLAWSGADRQPRASHRVMTGDELRELARRPGHAIGAHSTHHLALTTQPAATKRREVLENKAALEQLLGQPVNLFSYPYGDLDAETVTIVGEAGFHAAVTVEAGPMSAGTNRLLLPRCEIGANRRRGFPLQIREMFEGCLLSR